MLKHRLLLLPFAALSLVLGLLTGLLRIGWDIPVYGMAGHHGAMMLGGFLGSVMSLERAVVLKAKWSYAVPLVSGLSIMAFLLDQAQIGYLLLIFASIGLIAIYLMLGIGKKGAHLEFLLLGAICWLAGNVLLYKTQFYPIVFPWWMGFILFTIVGERLVLTKFLPVKKGWRYLLTSLLIVTLIGFMLPYHGVGRNIAGIGMIAITLWLLKFDLVKILIKKKGQFLYTGMALLLGYCWLAVSGALMVVNSNSQFAFDALIHTFFLGFTFSMIFAHGPIIFPSILGKTHRPFHNSLFVWLGLLHVSLLARIIMDFLELELRKWTGLLNGLSIILFLLTMVILLKKN